MDSLLKDRLQQCCPLSGNKESHYFGVGTEGDEQKLMSCDLRRLDGTENHRRAAAKRRESLDGCRGRWRRLPIRSRIGHQIPQGFDGLASVRIKFADIIDVSDSLFENMRRQFERVFSGADAGVSPASTAAGSNALPDSVGGFLQLQRSCIIMLQFLEFDLSLVVEKCHILTRVLRKLCPPYLHLHLPSREADDFERIDVLDVADPEGSAPTSLFCAMLEVFIHELLVHQQLRKHFTMTDYVSATTEKLFVSHHSHGGINAILELVASHFLLSVHDEWAFSRFVYSLSLPIKVNNEIPEIGLSAALELLGTPVMVSAPHLLQAHLILLASRCIGINMPTEGRKSDVVVINHYIKAFELSLNLYVRYMSTLDLVDNFIGLEGQSSCCTEELAFGSCIRPLTCDKLNHQIDKFVDFCNTHSHGVLSGTKADIVNNSIAYIIADKHIMDEIYRNETCLVLNYIISNILSGETEGNTLHKYGEGIKQEMYCLAAVLKLMSSSLLQILWHVKQNSCPVGMEKDHLHCKEYDFISDISCFGKYRASQPIKEVLLNVMGKRPRFEEMKMMFSHFASLLLCSFRRRLGILWKGCICMMMATMNLLILEEGNLDAFGPLLSNARENSSPQNSLLKTPKDLVHRRSSVIIASNLQNIQMLYLEDQVKFRTYENQWTGTRGSSKIETRGEHASVTPITGLGNPTTTTTEVVPCNGESYVSCLSSYRKNPSEFDDLVDFIECKPGKDYSGWLKKRKRFKEWQQQRRAVAKRQHRKDMAMKLVHIPASSSSSSKR